MKVKVSCTVMSNSAIPRTEACPAPLSMEFSRQKYWRICHFLLHLELISKINNLAVYKINTTRLTAFPYANNRQPKI